jgi:iron complex outermembrane receptor protein
VSRNHSWNSGWVGSLLLIGATNGTAADDLPSEADFFQTIPKVWSATRLSTPANEIPASVTIIDREMIEASTALNIPDLLRLVPGFQVAHANGAQYTATYHGAADQLARRLDIMVNGRSAYVAEYSTVEWNMLGVALEDIERIEVVRGSNSPAMGSNAIFGSVNIITRQPFELAGKYLRGTGGSLNTGIGVARLGGKIGKADAVATVQYTEDDGFEDVNDHKRIRNLRMQATHQYNHQDSVDLELGLSDGEVGADAPGTPEEPFRDRRLTDNYQKIEWRRDHHDGEKYRLTFWHRYHKRDDSYRLSVAPDLYLPLGFYNASVNSYHLEFEHELAPRPSWKLLWGASTTYDASESDLYLERTGGKASEWSGRLFASAEWWPARNLLVSLGGLTEFHERSDTFTSPRIGINWLINETHTLRASASRSYRVFSYASQVADYPLVLSDGTYIGQLLKADGPGLDPENLTNYELGYIANWPKHNLALDLKLFREEFRNESLGVRDPSGTTLWSDNGGWWNTNGFEAQLRYAPFRGTRFSAAYSVSKLDGTRPRGIDADGNLTDWISLDQTLPRHTFSMQLSQKFPRAWQGTLALFHLSDMKWLGEGGDVDGYTRLDLKVAKGFELGKADAELSLIAQNLLDDGYYEFRKEGYSGRDGNLFERRVYLQFALRWP